MTFSDIVEILSDSLVTYIYLLWIKQTSFYYLQYYCDWSSKNVNFITIWTCICSLVVFQFVTKAQKYLDIEII